MSNEFPCAASRTTDCVDELVPAPGVTMSIMMKIDRVYWHRHSLLWPARIRGLYLKAAVQVRDTITYSGYQPRRVVREGERERPSEVDSRLIREMLMGAAPRGGPHRRLILCRLENPEEADYTNQRMHFCSAVVVPASLLLRRVMQD